MKIVYRYKKMKNKQFTYYKLADFYIKKSDKN